VTIRYGDCCYDLLEEVRLGLNEYSDAYVKATDTSGAYVNKYLVKKINSAQKIIYNHLITRIPAEFLESASITGVDSVYALPANFGKLRWFKDDNGLQVRPIEPSDLSVTAATGSDRYYYRKGANLILDRSGVTRTFTLYYFRKPLDLTVGMASAGAATSITLATTARTQADYYNGYTLHNHTQDWYDEIDDYTAARVATISETAVASDYYGIVSDIPETFQHLIAPRALLEIRATSPMRMKPPTAIEYKEWTEQLVEALRGYAGSDLDKNVEDLFFDYEPSGPIQGTFLND